MVLAWMLPVYWLGCGENAAFIWSTVRSAEKGQLFKKGTQTVCIVEHGVSGSCESEVKNNNNKKKSPEAHSESQP